MSGLQVLLGSCLASSFLSFAGNTVCPKAQPGTQPTDACHKMFGLLGCFLCLATIFLLMQ
jgi:hypothetical protein